MSAVTKTGITYKKKHGFRLEMRRNGGYYVMLIPAMVLLFMFAYVPFPGLAIAFMNYNFRDGFFSPFVGFDNFVFLFQDEVFIRAFWKGSCSTCIIAICC